MKIKVDKQEYELLLERVAKLEEEIRDEKFSMFENWKWTRETLYKMMEDYFKSQCVSVIVKRDKDQIIGEVRKNAMDNIFKEDE